MRKFIQKTVLTLLALFYISQPFFGQALEENQEVRTVLDGMFQNLNKSKVPHGLLSDFAFELIELERFDGTQITDKNYIDRETYELMLRTIRSSAVGAKPFRDVTEIMKSQYGNTNSTTISLSGLAFQYSKIKANALTSNLIRYENGKVYDNTIGGVWQNPYETKYTVGICPQDSVFKGSSFVMKLNSDCWFSNLPYRSIEIDADGLGYRTISVGGSLNVSYSPGEHIIRMRINLTNGMQLYAHSVIETVNPVSTRAVSVTWTETGDPYLGISTTAEVTIRSAGGYGSTIRKQPFIVVEGFDPREMSKKDGNGKGATDAESFYKMLLIAEDRMDALGLITNNYDIVYVDWENSGEFLQSNSNTLQKIITKINQQKAYAGITAPNIIYGHSMGGVISRHALRTMENRGLQHNTSHYISHDAPHLGANVPLGALYALHGALSLLKNKPILEWSVNLFYDTGTLKDLVLGIAHCRAAKQLLVNYVGLNGNIDNSEHTRWQNELAALGFPQGDGSTEFRMLCMTNGSYEPNPNEPTFFKADFSASSDITGVLPGLSSSLVGILLQDIWAGLLNLLPGKSTLKGHIEINPGTASGVKITDLSVKYIKKFAWVANISKTIFSMRENMPSGLMWDNFPSSYMGTTLFNLDRPTGPAGIPVIGSLDWKVTKANSFPFIPTSSALCIGGGMQTLTTAMFTSEPEINNNPFGGNCIVNSLKSAEHTGIDSQQLEWLIFQLNAGIDGPKLGKTGSKYSVPRVGFSGVTWSTSNSAIATIDSNGNLRAVGNGVVNVIATVADKRLSKEIIVGTPRYVLGNPTREPGFFRIKAQCIESDAVKNLIEGNRGVILFYWGIKTDTEPLKWIPSDSSELLVSTLEETENTTIYLKIVDMYGNESQPVHVRISGYDIYNLAYNTLIINKNGVVYTDAGVQLSYAYGTMPLTFRSDSYAEFTGAKWSPQAGVVINDENITRGIPWVRVGYLRDIISKDDLSRILTFTNNQMVIYRLLFLNYERMVIQRTPITIIYKANFPN